MSFLQKQHSVWLPNHLYLVNSELPVAISYNIHSSKDPKMDFLLLLILNMLKYCFFELISIIRHIFSRPSEKFIMIFQLIINLLR
jgi:hypothetical protein